MVQPLPKMQSNPLAAIQAFTQPRRNQLAGLASGLLSSPNFGQGLSAGFAQAAQGRQIDDAYAVSQKEAADRQAKLEKTISYLRTQPGGATWAEAAANGYDPQEAFKGWYDSTQKASGGVAELKTGFTPIPGTIDGVPTIALPGNDGKLYINGAPIDPAKFVPTNPYDLNAQKAGGAAFGKATGGAQFSIPNAQGELDQSMAAINNLKTDPNVVAGMEDWFKQWGALPRGMWVQGGTNMAQFRNSALNVIDRSWLSARAALKGGGQITDYEGAKAENAVSMMKSALESGDKAQFESARDDYEYWVQQGFTKLQQQAGALPSYGGSGGAASSGGADDPLGIR